MAEIKYVSRENLSVILGKIKATYVQKVDGKGLSTNDLTNELLAKINGMGTVATLNEIAESNLSADLKAKVNAAAEGNHSHANKALLDTYTQTEENLADAVAKKHAHTNLTVLEGITSAKVAAWDAAEGNAKTYADGLDAAMGARVKAIEDDYLKEADKYDDTALAGRVAAIEADYLKEEDKYDDTALAGRVTANEQAIGVLIGNSSVDGSVDKKIADAINTFATQVTDDGIINTYKEALNYIATHGAEYTALLGEVEGNAAAIETLGGRMDTAEGAIDAVEARMDTAEGKITALETASGTFALKTELEAETSRATAAEAKALSDAKTYADGLNTTMAGRVKAIEDDYVKASELVALTTAEIDETWAAV